ncbi:hypothetical protein H0H81_010621 [Sphagnurus paluster]|uniref:non-specific serine/threonine protein kinase n=1 Tax=Sphagnurus paluster TaxID=117069 RepID=A0A9P7GQY6_9AGAR|nr:hypothetical protein H0H81_010621 [Sphagnurus paluster]
MELLGPSLGTLSEKGVTFNLKTVLTVADQMLSALAHVHGHGIVHRDVKPQNILTSLQNHDRFCLTDFGLAHPIPLGEPRMRRDPLHGRVHVLGSLNWASLNAHYGVELTRRDDLESLSYVLLSLLRGSLPWRNHAVGISATTFGRYAQVYQKRIAWPGSRLALGYPAEFGRFLDWARNLEFNETPDYAFWRSAYKELLSGSDVLDDKVPHEWSISEYGKSNIVRRSGVLRDPIQRRPFVDVEDLNTKRWVRISSRPANIEETDIVTLPNWSSDDAYLYAFPSAQVFTPLPGSKPLTRASQITAEDVEILVTKFSGSAPDSAFSPADLHAMDSIAKRNRRCKSRIYAAFTAIPLENFHSQNPSVDQTAPGADWDGMGWFDELVKTNKRRAADEGWPWTSNGHPREKDEDGDIIVIMIWASGRPREKEIV